MVEMESSAGPKAMEREQRVPILRQGDGGSVREEIGGEGLLYLELETAELRNLRRLPLLHYSFCCILVTLGILSVVSGFLAEVHSEQDKAYVARSHQCAYPGDEVILFSNFAAMFLIAAQVLATVVGCTIAYFTDGTATDSPFVNSGLSALDKYSVKFLLTSWIFCLVAFWNLAASTRPRNDNRLGGDCEVVKFGVFIKGSLFALASVFCDLAFYVTKYKTKVIVDTVNANTNRFSQDKSLANAQAELTEGRSPV